MGPGFGASLNEMPAPKADSAGVTRASRLEFRLA
jgi:hypothetical protein